MKPTLIALLCCMIPVPGVAEAPPVGLDVQNVRAVMTEAEAAEVYLEITNGLGFDVWITDAFTEVARDVDLVAPASIPGGTKSVYARYPLFENTTLELMPGSIHLSLKGLDMQLVEGDVFKMHLRIDPLGEVNLKVDVVNDAR